MLKGQSGGSRRAYHQSPAFGRRGRGTRRNVYEITAPQSLIEGVGAEDQEIYASPLKAEITEDAGDTKD